MAYYNIVLFLSILCPLIRAAQDYIPVSVCPPGAREWQIEAGRKKCQQPSPDYLCAAIENWPGHFGEICTKFGLSPSGTCVILNNLTHNVDSVPCKAQEGCPDKPYSPRELYNWPVCYGDFYGKDRSTSTQIKTNVQENTTLILFEPDAEPGDSGLIIGVVLAISLILICSLVVVFILDKRFKWELTTRLWSCVPGINHSSTEQTRNRGKDFRRNIYHVERQEDDTENSLLDTTGINHSSTEQTRNRERQEDDTENSLLDTNDTYLEPYSTLQIAFHTKDLTWNLAALKHYLVVILKQESKKEDLKHVTVLFKTTIIEHFGEALLKSFCNLNSLDDNQNLDISLVYNLLRNVCKNVTPPKRGWGYEPSDDDASLGADIERIRSIWNRYCDEDTEFLYLREIFVRMVNRYGNISDEVKLQDTDKKKILSFELNPECQIEDGVVLTKAIKSVLEILGREHIVVVIGALGTGKSTCLKYIENHYRRNQWEVCRKEKSITHLDLNVDGIKKLFCCDNLFGVYNRGNFAETDEIIKVLENIEQKVNHELKVVFAIHDHVYEELQKIHPIRVFKNKRVVVDFNELSDAEMLLILNDQREHGHCANDPTCWFRNVDFELVKNTLQENPGKLGDPILTLLYSNRHDIFIKREATHNIVKELCTIFQKMLENTPDMFNVLLYVMFVKTHSLDKNVEEWASELGGLNSITVKKNVSQLDAFLFVEADGSRIEIKHELLSFALFKCCASSMKYVFLLLKHCRFEMIEEIIRPVSTTNPGEFCVILEREMNDCLSSRIIEENLFEHLKEHPLLKEKTHFRYIFFSMSNEIGRKVRAVKRKNFKDIFST
ncbi:uncharacterized protein [Magallana gigas]|uniref:uncharacterized protein isoform X3 n=1 Tax=Magallana gigas TaxID=29159 RepID=UPI00333F25E9